MRSSKRRLSFSAIAAIVALACGDGVVTVPTPAPDTSDVPAEPVEPVEPTVSEPPAEPSPPAEPVVPDLPPDGAEPDPGESPIDPSADPPPEPSTAPPPPSDAPPATAPPVTPPVTPPPVTPEPPPSSSTPEEPVEEPEEPPSEEEPEEPEPGGSGGSGGASSGGSGAGSGEEDPGEDPEPDPGAGGDGGSSGAGGGPNTNPPIPGGLPAFRVAVIGSSTAAGVGASDGNGWVSLLETELATSMDAYLHVYNFAVGGYTAYDLLPGSGMSGSIDAAIADDPDLLIVALAGSNDLSSTATTESFVGQLAVLRETARAAGIPTFFMGTLPKNLSPRDKDILATWGRAMGDEFGSCWIPGVAAPYAPCFIDVFAALADSSLGLALEFDSGDGNHPNDAGHAVLFRLARDIVKPYVCAKTRCP